MGHCAMVMLVIFVVLTMNMDMRMGVRMLMGMDSISMAVFVGMGMVMLMGVLQFDGVLDHNDFDRAFVADHSGAVVFNAPTQTRP